MTDNAEKSQTTDKEISRSLHLSLVEILFGSLGHGLKVPFTGQFLSLYQLSVLANAINKDGLPRSSAVEISGIVSVFKSLSPAGQKLGPMLSILMQGILFWFGTVILGAQLLGQLLGATLLSLWSFVQPILTYSLIFGFDLLRMLDFYINKTEKEYPYAQTFIFSFLVSLIFIKIILGWIVIFYSYFRKNEWSLKTAGIEKYVFKSKLGESSIWRSALKDTLNPLFVLSFILMVVFLWQIETELSQIIWLSMRPLAVAFLIFYLIRSPLTHRFLSNQAKKSALFRRFFDKASVVLELIEKNRK